MTDAIALCLAGRLAPNVALARAILNGVDPRHLHARLAHESGESASALRGLLHISNVSRLRTTAEVGEIDHNAYGPHLLEQVKTGFSRAVSVSPEASVAAYSLGDPNLLDQITAELVEWLLNHNLLQPTHSVLDLGCGIGRVAAAIAPMVHSILATDVAPGMIAEAKRRYSMLTSVRFEPTDGLRLACEASSLDLIIAVDSFPYLIQAGVADQHVADAATALRPGGALALFNLSYCGAAFDRIATRTWHDTYGFRMIVDGITPFTLWDGAVFVMTLPAD